MISSAPAAHVGRQYRYDGHLWTLDEPGPSPSFCSLGESNPSLCTRSAGFPAGSSPSLSTNQPCLECLPPPSQAPFRVSPEHRHHGGNEPVLHPTPPLPEITNHSLLSAALLLFQDSPTKHLTRCILIVSFLVPGALSGK